MSQDGPEEHLFVTAVLARTKIQLYIFVLSS